MENSKVLDYFNGDELAASTWKNKYAAQGEETPDDTHKRLAHEFARIEEKYRWEKDPNSSLKLSNYGYSRDQLTEEKIYNLFKNYKYVIPGGSVMSGAGTNELVSLSNCFIAGTKVLTNRGLINIEDIKEGDFVLSDDNQYHRVNSTMKRDYEGDLYKFSGKEFYDDIICTPNHKFLTNHGWKRADRILACSNQLHTTDKLKTSYDVNKTFSFSGEGEVINILDNFSVDINRTIKEDNGKVYTVSTINNHEGSKINKEFIFDSDLAYFVGRWIGDGSITRRKGYKNPSILQIVFNASSEKDAFEKCKKIGEEKFGLNSSTRETDQNVLALRFESEILSTWFLNTFGEKCTGKHIPDKYLGNINILSGICDSDGMISTHGSFKLTLKNKGLIEWVRKTMYLNNINANSIKKENNLENTYTVGVITSQANGRLNSYLSKSYHDKRENKINIENCEYATISNIEILEDQKTTVYNISVEDTHTYNVNGVICHNCFVVGSPRDSYADIMKTRAEQAQLMKRRGGVGYDLSELRPRGAKVNNAAKTSTGAASFMDVCSDITNEVAQNGRRGALMLSMNINHPDIEEFITKKQDLTKVTGANISVKVTDEFMKAVENDEDYYLRYPVTQDLSYFSKDYLDVEYNKLAYLEDHKNNNNKVFYVKKIKAKELWNTLMHCAWNTAEPGIMFESTMHNYSPDGVYPNFKMISTNPSELFQAA